MGPRSLGAARDGHRIPWWARRGEAHDPQGADTQDPGAVLRFCIMGDEASGAEERHAQTEAHAGRKPLAIRKHSSYN